MGHPLFVVLPRRTCFPISSCFEWGLPCDRCHHRPGELLPRRFTLTAWKRGGLSLLHFPRGRPHQPLAGTLPCEARTFLPLTCVSRRAPDALRRVRFRPSAHALQAALNAHVPHRNTLGMENEKPTRERENDDETLNDPWFHQPGRSLIPALYPSERPVYDYMDTRRADMDIDDAWFV